MLRVIAAAVLVLLWPAVVVTGQTTPRLSVNLNRPGVLEALEESNRAHHEKIRQILEGVLKQPYAEVPDWIQTNFDARNVKFAPILMTSNPPKRRLSFTLDETHYQAVVTLTKVRALIVPVK